ncbi:MAG: menaquinone-dependent protoporphyrinogen IX dehydrogenase [Bifidobacteriaceae bacterium]|jgi:menaquinone-dependent protoporphyrinogen oxidase|nr:menaquinone-dependent protoporphyrinogen IX dehydrogenase [Bifidobacteriaceae bacterium]
MTDHESDDVLVAHAGRFGGQSRKIAEAMAEQLRAEGVGATVVDLASGEPAGTVALTGRRGIVLVASVQYGRFSKALRRLVARRRSELDAAPTMFVTVSLTARNAEKRDPAVHSYTRKFLEESGWSPSRTEVVAGALHYPSYHWWDRKAIQLIMRITDGPTDPTLDIEYTDWDQVRAAATAFASAVKG